MALSSCWAVLMMWTALNIQLRGSRVSLHYLRCQAFIDDYLLSIRAERAHIQTEADGSNNFCLFASWIIDLTKSPPQPVPSDWMAHRGHDITTTEESIQQQGFKPTNLRCYPINGFLGIFSIWGLKHGVELWHFAPKTHKLKSYIQSYAHSECRWQRFERNGQAFSFILFFFILTFFNFIWHTVFM